MRTSTFSRRTAAIGIVAALVGVAVGMVTVLTTRSARRDRAVLTAMGGSGSQAPDPTAAESVAPSEAGRAADAADAAAASMSEAAAAGASDTASPDAGAQASVAALVPLCADVTARRDTAVRAAEVTLEGWKQHYGAQFAFDRGEISSDEAAERWAASKAPAQRNLDDLAAAADAIGDDEPCADLADGGGAGAGAVDGLEACLERTDLATAALDAAQEPLQGWRDHLEMMASKGRYSTGEYLQQWDRMVSDAPGEMRPFDDAVAEWRDAPACAPTA